MFVWVRVPFSVLRFINQRVKESEDREVFYQDVIEKYKQ